MLLMTGCTGAVFPLSAGKQPRNCYLCRTFHNRLPKNVAAVPGRTAANMGIIGIEKCLI